MLSAIDLEYIRRAKEAVVVHQCYEDLALKGWAMELYDDLHFTDSTVPRYKVLVKRRLQGETVYYNKLIGRGFEPLAAFEEAVRNTIRFDNDVDECPF